MVKCSSCGIEIMPICKTCLTEQGLEIPDKLTRIRLQIATKHLITCKIYLEGNSKFPEATMKQIENFIALVSEAD